MQTQRSPQTVLSLHAVFLQYLPVFTGLSSFTKKKGKVSAAVVTLGNMLLPVCYRWHGLHFPLTSTEKLLVQSDLWCFLHVWQLSLFYLYYLLCFCWTHLSKFLGRKKKRQWGRIFLWMSKWCGRSPWSATNLCPVVPLWPLRDIWMYVWLPGPALFSQPVLYVFFLILGCTSGKRLPSTPQYVPQWHFTRVLVRVSATERWICLCNG